jgi:hypothetical protein
MKKITLLLILSFGLLMGHTQVQFFDPGALEATLGQNDSVVLYTILHNYSETDALEFDFPQYSGDGQGGPDDFGYSWIDSDEPNGPDWAWTEISETGTPVQGLSDDNVVGPFDIGFEFPFYGETQTQFWIQSNGCVSFNGNLIQFANQPIPTANYQDFIAWFWDDLMIDPGFTSIYYKTLEGQLVVQFNKMTHYPGTEEWITAQVMLKSNGTIFIRYKQIRENFPEDNGTVGIQSGDPELGLQVVYNAPYLHSELAIRFDLNRTFITSVVPASGVLPPNSQEHIWITYSSAGYEAGSYEQDIKCLFNRPEHPYEIVHNVMHVTNPNQAGFKGFVTRASNGEPINDVKVIAGEQHVFTNSDGYYELPLEQGVYNVKFMREGFQTLIVEDTTALPGMSILDVELDGFYFIAGQVFAGEPHIETGFAYGYKMLEGTVVDIYAEMVGEQGWYEFSGLASAQYIIKAEPSPNSMYYGDFLPTYYGDVLHWEEATVINLTAGTESAHIHLIPATMASQGPGSISGTISTENGRAGAANVPVILRATETEEFYMTYSGSDGTFQFTGLDLAAYEIFAEVPGKSITPQAIVLDELHTSVSGIEMLIMQTQIIFVGAGITDVFETAPVIYPNPVKNQLNVAIDPVQPVIVMISITDLVGRTILREEHEINSAETMVLDVSRLAKGIYSLTITGLDASITEKIIK